MKKVRHIATFADLLILAIIVIINPTAIKDIHTPSSSVTKGKNGTYDLNGRRVQKGNAQRGIVIENGKKVKK